MNFLILGVGHSVVSATRWYNTLDAFVYDNIYYKFSPNVTGSSSTLYGRLIRTSRRAFAELRR